MWNNAENAYKYFVLYVDSYDDQPHWKEYSQSIYINDMLYGLGVSLDPTNYKWASGYDEWLHVLKDFIEEELEKNGRQD